MTATAAPAPIFDRAKACSYTFTVSVLVPAFPPVRRKMSSNLLKVQINLNKKRILKIPNNIGMLRDQNFWNGDAPSISAASYISSSIDCIRAKIKRNESGKYRQISNTVTIISARGRFPKKFIGVSITCI